MSGGSLDEDGQPADYTVIGGRCSAINLASYAAASLLRRLSDRESRAQRYDGKIDELVLPATLPLLLVSLAPVLVPVDVVGRSVSILAYLGQAYFAGILFRQAAPAVKHECYAQLRLDPRSWKQLVEELTAAAAGASAQLPVPRPSPACSSSRAAGSVQHDVTGGAELQAELLADSPSEVDLTTAAGQLLTTDRVWTLITSS